jgi:hypothetical protein
VEATRPKLRLTAMLTDLATERAGGHITIGELVDRCAHAGFGFVIGMLALISIPFVGLSTPFGLVIAFVAAQMLFGRQRPWVVGWLRRRRLSAATLAGLGRRIGRWTRRLGRLVKPRWPVWVTGSLWPLVGLGIVVQALGLALPLPIPGSNAIFLAPILIYAIGLLEDDGALILIGHGATLVNIALCVVFSVLVKDAVVQMLRWVS